MKIVPSTPLFLLVLVALFWLHGEWHFNGDRRKFK